VHAARAVAAGDLVKYDVIDTALVLTAGVAVRFVRLAVVQSLFFRVRAGRVPR
jgi:hypothetical protein